MGTSLVLFRLFDIDVRVHWSFLLIVIYGAFIFSSGPAGPLTGSLYGILITLLLFACVLAHEFGHSLVAKYYKINVSNITLLPIGGVANLERMPDKPMQEFLIAIAGPLVNFILALIIVPLMMLGAVLEMGGTGLPNSAQEFARGMQQPGLTNLLIYLLATNILLGVFNLLPAFPMDGGRVLRALLAMTMAYVQATRIAVLVGRIMAVLFAVWGIFSGNIILLLIAFFVYIGGGAEREAVESRTVLKHVTAREALTEGAVSLYSSERLSRAVDLIMNSYQTDYPVLDLSGTFIGVLTRQRMVQALRSSGAETRVVDVMLAADEVPVVAPTTSLDEVWEKMVTGGTRVVAVKEQSEFMGLLTLDDITEVFQVVGASMKHDRSTPSGGTSTTSTSDTKSEEQKPADA